jgi:hypothetical protein
MPKQSLYLDTDNYLLRPTMITFQEARQIAEVEINKYQTLNNDSLIIVDDQTIEKEYAWIFPYTSKKYLETNDINYAIGGNGPLFISKLDGQVYAYRTGLSIEGMIDEHEEKNRLWTLTIANDISDTTLLVVLKKALGWTQEQLTDFKKGKDKALDRGSRKRLEQIQSLLNSSNIKTDVTLTKTMI